MKAIAAILLLIALNFNSNCARKAESSVSFAKPNADKNVNEKFSNVEISTLPKLINPRLVVKKSIRKLELLDGEKLIKTYNIALGFAPIGDKQIEGDGKTPEGEFYIFTRNEQSKFYLSLGVSYPNIEDATRGLAANLISKSDYDKIVEAVKAKQKTPQNTKLGGEVYIHGGGASKDWTEGCVALENADIKELFDAIPIGASVKIEP